MGMLVHHLHALCPCRPKDDVRSWELELQEVLKHHVDAGN